MMIVKNINDQTTKTKEVASLPRTKGANGANGANALSNVMFATPKRSTNINFNKVNNNASSPGDPGETTLVLNRFTELL